MADGIVQFRLRNHVSDISHHWLVRENLRDILQQGRDNGWTDDFRSTMPFMAEAALDVSRMFGCSLLGKGSLPIRLDDLLYDVGLVGLLVDPAERMILRFWKDWLIRHNIGFKDALLGNTTGGPGRIIQLAELHRTNSELEQSLDRILQDIDQSPNDDPKAGQSTQQKRCVNPPKSAERIEPGEDISDTETRGSRILYQCSA